MDMSFSKISSPHASMEDMRSVALRLKGINGVQNEVTGQDALTVSSVPTSLVDQIDEISDEQMTRNDDLGKLFEKAYGIPAFPIPEMPNFE